MLHIQYVSYVLVRFKNSKSVYRFVYRRVPLGARIRVTEWG